MLKVLIVDDERLDASLLAAIGDWQALNMQIIGIAADGKSAKKLYSDHKPDIVITDIVMPCGNGTELAEWISRQDTFSKIIFLSGHRDFSFAQSGIKSGVERYLLKPVERLELNKALADAAKACIAEKKQRFEQDIFKHALKENMPRLREDFLRRWANGGAGSEEEIKEQLDFYGIRLGQSGIVALLLRPDRKKNPWAELDWRLSQLKLQSVAADAMKTFSIVQNDSCVFPNGLAGEVMLLLGISDKDWHERAGALSAEICSMTKNLCGFEIYIGVGKRIENFVMLPEACSSAEIALSSRYFAESGRIVFFEDIAFDRMDSDITFFSALYKDNFISATFEVDIHELDRLCNKLLDELSRKNVSLDRVRLFCVETTGSACENLRRINEIAVTGLDLRYYEPFSQETVAGVVTWMRESLFKICIVLKKLTLKRSHSIAEAVE
ncbi:MAG: response regulator, partial [Bacillota bacterium]|nr:response regulator [Bacillota bacterium]